ncbi:hypothetical protein C2E25_01490 [Geothermobacter hydrogeniphilus]|uniref:CBS domain-containing protein n=1 Tax=Geothermobacter hydrogeniphilus TaxID=1969733 RepID=A0A2K2HE86_9BACT|nr:CBS domain-containing protein [Geothermobacter hydrogeniphilus]PNU21563.1 hypothetical protein C2E25_01490 [Geothermobacter hydrogeniphilus]
MLTAADIMTREVYTVTPDTSVDELGKKFVELDKNALPVLDEQKKLFGIVTQTDLVEQDRPLHIPTVISIFDWVFYLESEKEFRQEVEKVTARRVDAICRRDPPTCRPETPVAELAQMMVDKKVHLIPVVDDNRHVLGVVGRLDIIRSMNL